MDNGELTAGEKAIEEGRVCGVCKARYPRDRVMAIAMIEQQTVITKPKAPQGTMVILCANPASERFQQVLSVHGSCDKCDPIEEVDVPKGIAKRMKGE